MASEIRVNQIQSRTGVSTVSFTDSGPIFAGISTVQGTLTVGNTVVNGGSVGIGTDSPDSPLHVYNSTVNSVALFESGDANCSIHLTDSSGSVTFNTRNNGTLRISTGGDSASPGTNATEKLTITKTGDVGIGTDTPTEKLEIRDGGLLINGSNLTGILTEDILDDTFVSIDLTQPGFIPGGLFLITTFAGGTNPFVFPQAIGTGLVYYDCGNSIAGARILADADTGATPLLGGTTSTSTTITDFTDGRVTIICNTNTLRIANRAGGTRRFKLTFV